MQQAEMARSICAGCASAGNETNFSGRTETIDLIAFPITEFFRQTDEGFNALYDAQSILRTTLDLASEASCEKGFWPRQPGWAEARFEQLYRLISIADDMVERSLTQLAASQSKVGDAAPVEQRA